MLQEDALAWQHMSDGLAMFLRPGWHSSYRVPVSLPELATVGERFVTGPLMRVVTRDSHFLLLALSQRHVRLFEGNMQRLEELELRDVPGSLRAVVEAPQPRADSMARTLSSGGRGGRRAVFYGYGAADGNFKKEEMHEFLRQVANGLGSTSAARACPWSSWGSPRRWRRTARSAPTRTSSRRRSGPTPTSSGRRSCTRRRGR